ncbi:MAG: hypothetical protein KDJ63_11055 [Nitratireductor sp.]|nr:hypothetical protein [Nitratireductor sp.]
MGSSFGLNFGREIKAFCHLKSNLQRCPWNHPNFAIMSAATMFFALE